MLPALRGSSRPNPMLSWWARVSHHEGAEAACVFHLWMEVGGRPRVWHESLRMSAPRHALRQLLQFTKNDLLVTGVPLCGTASSRAC